MVSLSSYTQYYQAIFNTENYYQYTLTGPSIVRNLQDTFNSQLYPTNTTPLHSGGLSNRIPNNNTVGAIPIPPLISGGTLKLLAHIQYPASIGDLQLICDRLLDTGNISTSATTVQTINLSGLTRYTGGTGVFAFMSLSANTPLFGTVACQISYTNQDGISGRITTFPFTQDQQNALSFVSIVPLVSGDTGIRSIETLQFTSTLNAANARIAYICMFKLIGSISQGYLSNNSSRTPQNFINGNFVGGFPNIEPNACLFKIRGGQLLSGLGTGNEFGYLVIKEVYDV